MSDGGRGAGATAPPGYARAIFRDLYDAIETAPDPPATSSPDGQAWLSLSRDLRTGPFRVCGSASS